MPGTELIVLTVCRCQQNHYSRASEGRPRAATRFRVHSRCPSRFCSRACPEVVGTFQTTYLDSADQLVACLTASAGYTQFELAQMTLRWCQVHRVQFEEFLHLSVPTLLSPEEKPWFLAQLAPYERMREAINSDLPQSSLLNPQELGYVGLRGARTRWKFHQAVTRSGPDFLLKCDYRIGAPMKTRLAVGDHVRFICVECPEDRFVSQIMPFEALVEKFDVGRITLKCLRHPAAIYRQCLWRLEHCGSFVTAQTMIDAVVRLISENEACCEVYKHLMTNTPFVKINARAVGDLSELNPITCIWGLPGTGKTHTIVAIIDEILQHDIKKRLLVTAPTHNAVDNVMRRYLKNKPKCTPVRVSTDVHKVSSDLLAYTCDAMLDKDINRNPGARRKAQKAISQARLVFSTCIGAGLGLLQDECFEDAIIDEASQQTEPASHVPIVKGCSRLVLVGDHVQLRATVQPHAAALGYDVSLFESLWSGDSQIERVVLDTQYRMHPSIFKFPSDEFYKGKLKSAAHCQNVKIPISAFPWPKGHRMVLVQCSAPEDLSRKSKSNAGQAELCQEIMPKLRQTLEGGDYSIAIPTLYARQAELTRADSI